MTLAALEAFLITRLAGPLPGAEVQRRFAPRPPHKGWAPELVPEGARRAAALLLLYPGADGPTIPLTVRHSEMPTHAGQVSLPGGRVDPGEDPAAAALREADEEIGVRPADVRIIGALSSLWIIVSNHVVYPYVGVADSRPSFALAAREVEALVEAPFSHVRNAAHVKWMSRKRDGLHVDIPHFALDGREVWGATAMILGEFVNLFDTGFAPPDL